TGTFTITRTGTTGTITVNYALTGTAANATDYTTPTTTATTNAGPSTAVVTATPTTDTDVAAPASTLPTAPPRASTPAASPPAPTDDSNVEAAETAILTIAAGTGYAPGSPATGTINIAADVPDVTLTATDAVGAELGSDPVTFHIARNGTGLVNSGNLTVNY